MQCITISVEPHLLDSHLSLPSIICNDVQKFLIQVIPNCWACDPSFNKASSTKSMQMCLFVSRQDLAIETRHQIDLIKLSPCC